MNNWDCFGIGPLIWLVLSIFSFVAACVFFILLVQELEKKKSFVRAVNTAALDRVASAGKRRNPPSKKPSLANILEEWEGYVEEMEEKEGQIMEWVEDLSHDLKTPLGAIRGYTEIIQDQQANNAVESAHLKAILRLSAQMQEMLEDLSEVSRLRTLKDTSTWETLSFAELVMDNLHLYQNQLDNRGLDLKIEAINDLLLVKGNPRLLQRAIQNLLQNSIKYSPLGGEIKLALEREGLLAKMTLSNLTYGQTISSWEDLIGRHHRGKGHQEKGSGLGLPIVVSIAKLHEGSLQMLSIENGKASFILQIPLLKV